VPDLRELGFTASFVAAFAPHAERGLVPARVAVEHRGAYACYAASGELVAELAGRLRHRARERAYLPTVGDWVAVEEHDGARGTIHALLPRRSAFIRAATGPGPTESQVLAANVDAVFIVAALAADLTPLHRRVERYLALAYASRAEPVIVLAKADLAADAEAQARVLGDLAPGVPVHVTSALTGDGIAQVRRHISSGRTVTLIGPSGAGKSTLINRLHGSALLATREVDAAGQGRHATIRRELVMLPGGGVVLDSPGLRDIPLWISGEGVAHTYADLSALADRCRFRDCAHHGEPGCAIAVAIADGSLEVARLEAWRDLEREQAHTARRLDKRLAAESKRRWRTRNRAMRAFERRQGGWR
jgi:ribosome biogenesis GTPase